MANTPRLIPHRSHERTCLCASRRGDIIAHAFHGRVFYLTDEGAVLAEVRRWQGKDMLYLMPPRSQPFFTNTHAGPSPPAFFRISSVAISQPSLQTRLGSAARHGSVKHLALPASRRSDARLPAPMPQQFYRAANWYAGPRAFADIAIFKLKTGMLNLPIFMVKRSQGRMLVPQMTIKP